MAWIYLFIAGLFEIGWAIGLKYTEGFSRLVPSVLTVGAMVASIVLLGIALKTLPVGTAYAVWTGIGAVGTATLGIYLFGEPATAARLASIGLIVVILEGIHYRHLQGQTVGAGFDSVGDAVQPLLSAGLEATSALARSPKGS